MKNLRFTHRKMIGLLAIILITMFGCERELSDEAVFATFPTTAEVFTDNPVGMGTDFYFPYGGSKPNAWTVDTEVSYIGNASMRFDVPNANDPSGNFAGAIFRIDGEGSGRDLSGFDALTFWAKATQAVTVGEIGFGEDFEENKFLTTRLGVDITTNWRKYVIPIPDPSKLIRERGMLRYSAGGIGPVGNEVGYTFWIDELRFEKLGTVAQQQPMILFGQDVVQQSFNGSIIDLSIGLNQIANVDGSNVTVFTTPAYFDFTSSNPSVASVDEKGIVTILSQGTAKITASLAGVEADGSFEVTSSGDLPPSPTPTRPAANVSSVFSDAYPNATNSNFSPGFGGSTTSTSLANLNGNNVRIYSNNNFTGIVFESTIDASSLTHIHVDVFTQDAGTNVEFQVRDVGANGEIETNIFNGLPDGDDKDFRFTATPLTQGSWTSFDIPLGGDLVSQKNNLGAIILAGGPNFILDNIYFYTE